MSSKYTDGRLSIFDETLCQLGEGPLWHPLDSAYFWFDIIGKILYRRQENAQTTQSWQFSEFVTAAQWIDKQHILIASERELFQFNFVDESRHHVVALEPENIKTRPNDGRGDPHGGFWISTMSLDGCADAGSIYRYFRGELRQLHTKMTVPNGICFSPDARIAYFSDSARKLVFTQALDADGWPCAPATTLIDFTAEKTIPDGACTDSDGNIWIAVWGGSRIVSYAKDGRYIGEVLFPVSQPTCPTFGGQDLNQLMVTSANIGLIDSSTASEVSAGATFMLSGLAQGWPCHPVILDSTGWIAPRHC